MQYKNIVLQPLLMILVILPMLATDIYLPVISSIGEDFAASYSALMLTLTSYMVGYSISLLLAGMLADIYGRRIIVLTGVSIFALASLACCFVTSVEELTWCRFFQALGGGCSTLLARVIVRDLYDFRSQVRVLSYLAAALVASPILGPSIGAYLTVNLGWRSTFYALTFFSLTSLVFICVFLKESMVSSAVTSSFSPKYIWTRYLELLSHHEFMFHTLVISFAWAVYFSFISSSPGILQKIYHLTSFEYGYLFSITISGYILGTIFIRRNIANMEIKDLIYFSGLIILISTTLLVVLSVFSWTSLFILLPSVFIALFGVGVIFPATQAGVTRSFNADIGLISGLFYSVEMMFGAIASFILSRFPDPSWMATSLLMFCGGIAIFGLSNLDKFSGFKFLGRHPKGSLK